MPDGGENKLKHLRAFLNQLAQDHPEFDELVLWQGTDSGEGYLSLNTVLVVSSRHVPLDGDEESGETFYVDEKEAGQRLADMDPSYTCVRTESNGQVIGYRDIIVFGGYDSQQAIELARAEEARRDARDKRKQDIAVKEAALQADPDYQVLLSEETTRRDRLVALRTKHGLGTL